MPDWLWALAAVVIMAAIASTLLCIAVQVGSTRARPEREHARRTREVLALEQIYDQAPIGETDA